jgi:16S rRNA processing protein RimM
LGKKTDLAGVQAIFLNSGEDKFLPHFLSQAKASKTNETIIKLEDIHTMESARKLTPKDVWLLEKDFNQHKSQESPIALLGFHIINNGTDLGEIIEIFDMPHQTLCTIIINGKEVLIPIHPDNTLKIDRKEKRIEVDVPDGLLEVYE